MSHIISSSDFDNFKVNTCLASDTNTRKQLFFRYILIEGFGTYLVFQNGQFVFESHDVEKAIDSYNSL